MKLLKLPSKLHDGQLTQCEVDDNKLYIIGGKYLSIWDSQTLLNAATGKTDVKEVKELEKMSLDLLESNQEDGRWLVVLDNQRLVYGSDHLLACLDLNKDSNSEYKSREIGIFKDNEAITDLKYDKVNGLLFVSLSKANSLQIMDSKTWELKSSIELKSKPISIITDPLGQLLTVILQNRSVQIYQYDSHGTTKLHQSINQFVQTNPLPYRMTMSPQGDVIPMINSLHNNVPTAVLLDRIQKFKIKLSLVGYVADCKILKFSPRIYSKTKSPTSNDTQTFNLLASSGNEDGNVVVWNTNRIKPLFDASKVVNSYITDLEWDNSGLGLFAISQDGQLVIFAFQENELGDVMPVEAVTEAAKEIKLLDPLPFKPKAEEPDTKLPPNKTAQQTTTNSKKQPKAAEITTISSTNMEFIQPSYMVPKDLKRKPVTEDPLLAQNKPANKKAKKELDQIDFLDTNLFLPSVSFSKVRLAHPKIRASFQYSSQGNFVLDIKNGLGNDQKPTSITLTRKDNESSKQLFQTFLPKFVTLCSAGSSFWAWSTDTGMIYVTSISGQMLFPPMLLGVPVSFLEGSGDYLLCITSIGQMYCWNVNTGKIAFPINDVYSLLNPMLRYSDDVLSRAENITMCAVTSQGIPIVTLSNGDGYMFDSAMEAWMLINDSWWPYGSQYWNFMSSAGVDLTSNDDEKKDKYWNAEADILAKEVKNNKNSIINYLETKTNDELTRKGRMKHLQRFAKVLLMKEGFENLEEMITLAHLENKILVSFRLKEVEEAIRLLKIYCIRIAEMGYTDRFSQTLSWLYDPTNTKFSPLDIDRRRNLIKDIIISCANIRQVQRVTTSYANELGVISDSL
ncbi:Hir2p [Kluyveromyces lactis]|uniref:Protein HIR2 n=1 Tax=Kluyveromyces lactis (strain ATCC 8585 / CBS 2359 / DSM 70799 / NBRC 1267 / NRRL Y-1140 / WM37) TaxID=284590 RepID=HIR2_KLULA|nr:uncharacterized protein KLLA0_E21847g [Kluyveromyces lactis]Q6CM99.1 RecName: Full=Protein HIR2 [Kluyveromyces lactis NRRL Y-1140]CAH00027.1 KLLA0E21847p [Kluyveromyces lactis]|eukprot:XP_454940.1 uncharacterized protein KLLA0_E21847g [Kluyveromyces lactis]